jgi:nicotinamide-nucleotide amidase
VALAMAAGALWRSQAAISAAITGVAGPGGGSADKPVGLVHFAVAKRVSISSGEMNFSAIHHAEMFGDLGRAEIREESVATALKLLRQTGSL